MTSEKTVESTKPNNRTKADLEPQTKVTITSVSPHNKAVYEAGKKMLTDSIDVGRDFCKTMITISTGAIPIYISILKLIGVQKIGDISFTTAFGLLATSPCLLFLVASIVYILGYFPGRGEFSLDIIQEIDAARRRIIQRRMRLIILATVLFSLSVVLSFVTLLDILFT